MRRVSTPPCRGPLPRGPEHLLTVAPNRNVEVLPYCSYGQYPVPLMVVTANERSDKVWQILLHPVLVPPPFYPSTALLLSLIWFFIHGPTFMHNVSCTDPETPPSSLDCVPTLFCAQHLQLMHPRQKSIQLMEILSSGQCDCGHSRVLDCPSYFRCRTQYGWT